MSLNMNAFVFRRVVATQIDITIKMSRGETLKKRVSIPRWKKSSSRGVLSSLIHAVRACSRYIFIIFAEQRIYLFLLVCILARIIVSRWDKSRRRCSALQPTHSHVGMISHKLKRRRRVGSSAQFALVSSEADNENELTHRTRKRNAVLYQSIR